jgi:hypothetical protein
MEDELKAIKNEIFRRKLQQSRNSIPKLDFDTSAETSKSKPYSEIEPKRKATICDELNMESNSKQLKVAENFAEDDETPTSLPQPIRIGVF